MRRKVPWILERGSKGAEGKLSAQYHSTAWGGYLRLVSHCNRSGSTGKGCSTDELFKQTAHQNRASVTASAVHRKSEGLTFGGFVNAFWVRFLGCFCDERAGFFVAIGEEGLFDCEVEDFVEDEEEEEEDDDDDDEDEDEEDEDDDDEEDVEELEDTEEGLRLRVLLKEVLAVDIFKSPCVSMFA